MVADYKCECGNEFRIFRLMKVDLIMPECPVCNSNKTKRLWCTSSIIKGYSYKNGYSDKPGYKPDYKSKYKNGISNE